MAEVLCNDEMMEGILLGLEFVKYKTKEDVDTIRHIYRAHPSILARFKSRMEVKEPYRLFTGGDFDALYKFRVKVVRELEFINLLHRQSQITKYDDKIILNLSIGLRDDFRSALFSLQPGLDRDGSRYARMTQDLDYFNYLVYNWHKHQEDPTHEF